MVDTATSRWHIDDRRRCSEPGSLKRKHHAASAIEVLSILIDFLGDSFGYSGTRTIPHRDHQQHKFESDADLKRKFMMSSPKAKTKVAGTFHVPSARLNQLRFKPGPIAQRSAPAAMFFQPLMDANIR
jgi:hypothetical protein